MPKAYLIDMDGVLVHGRRPIPGAAEFIRRLRDASAPFLILTNNSRHTPADHAAQLQEVGIPVDPGNIFTSAIATARFVAHQRPGASVYAIGEIGLLAALQAEDLVLSQRDPDYVVLGETVTYSFEQITTATRLVQAGARFIGTNPDTSGPAEHGIVPATGAVAALISAASGVRAYFVGKPNPLMMRAALTEIGAHAKDAVMVGDRMDTDIVAGTETGMDTILVLSGVTRREEVGSFAYLPTHIVGSVAEIVP
ncbi:MAG: HAD-IIA family hydrolase [Geminicoccaceae bacterium]